MISPASAVHRARARLAHVATLTVAGLAAAGIGCAPPAGGLAGQGALLYVANGQDGTITRLEGQTGRVVGRPLPAGPAPGRMVVGANGSLLVVPIGAGAHSAVTHVVPAGGAWAARHVALEPGARVSHVAADGEHTAAVAYSVYRLRDGERAYVASCRLALIDLRSGTVGRVHQLCSAGETITGLALEAGPAGPLAYAGIWSERPDEPVGGRVLALDVARGAVVATFRLQGIPGALVIGPAPGRAGRRLYSVATTGLPEDSFHDGGATRFAEARGWQLLGLNPTTLDVESVTSLRRPPFWLTVAPDGDDAYAIVGPGNLTPGTMILHVDLATGDNRILGRTPGAGISALAVSGDRIYVPDAMADAVWALDRRRGYVVNRVTVGRRPLGITSAAV